MKHTIRLGYDLYNRHHQVPYPNITNRFSREEEPYLLMEHHQGASSLPEWMYYAFTNEFSNKYTVEYVDIQEATEPYFYILCMTKQMAEMHEFITEPANDEFLKLPDKLFRDCKKGIAKIVIYRYDTSSSYLGNYNTGSFINDRMRYCNLPKDSVILLDDNFSHRNDHNNLYRHLSLLSYVWLIPPIEKDLTFDLSGEKSLALCNSTRPALHHELMIESFMDGILDSIVMWGLDPEYSRYQLYDDILDQRYKMKLTSLIDRRVNNHGPVIDPIPGWHHRTTFVNIVNEYNYTIDSAIITSETLHTILNCQPFIINGAPGTLKALKQLGFKTFSDFWDESYDDEISLDRRLEKIISILNMLRGKDLTAIRTEMQSILEHNYDKFIQLRGKDRSTIVTLTDSVFDCLSLYG